MGFDLDVRTELVAQRLFEAACHVVRGGKRQRALDFEIDRYRQPAGNRLHGDVMNGKAAIARDHHDAFAHRFVVERARLGGDGDFGPRQLRADSRDKPILDGGDAVERQRAADADAEIDEQHGAGRPGTYALDRNNAGQSSARLPPPAR